MYEICMLLSRVHYLNSNNLATAKILNTSAYTTIWTLCGCVGCTSNHIRMSRRNKNKVISTIRVAWYFHPHSHLNVLQILDVSILILKWTLLCFGNQNWVYFSVDKVRLEKIVATPFDPSDQGPRKPRVLWESQKTWITQIMEPGMVAVVIMSVLGGWSMRINSLRPAGLT